MSGEVLAELTRIVGERRIVLGPAVGEREFPWNTHTACNAKAIAMPESSAELAAIMACCHKAEQTVVPFGGTTNLVQGCATSGDDIVLSLERMNSICEVDRAERTLTAGAGLTLQAAQDAASEHGLYFPVDIGARANCQLGGLVAMNAGGNKVIRYGMMRDSVLGLEVVLADGTVISSMNRYIKNNSGFDLKHMFIGSEGVLGIITQVVIRLRAEPKSHNVALLAVETFDDVIAILERVSTELATSLTAFEVMWNSFYELAVEPRGRLPAPLEPGVAHYVLIETMGVEQNQDTVAFESMLESLLEDGLFDDGMMAKSVAECALIWEIRDEVEPVIGGAHNFDVSLRSRDIGDYLQQVSEAIATTDSAACVIGFGHLGDNNVHVSVSKLTWDRDSSQAVEAAIYGCLEPFAGAISAEHGIGLEKRAFLPVSRTTDELALMATLKRTLDPRNILNPGKVVGEIV